MFDIYQKKRVDSFAGKGKEWIVVQDGLILAHGCSWNDPSVSFDFEPTLQNMSVDRRGPGWRRVWGFRATNDQHWAQNMVDLAQGRL